MSFEQRRKSAEEFEEELFVAIEGLGFVVARNGTEHTHPDFVRQLHGSNDQTSLAIRFQPDGVASIGRVPRSFYVEAKNSKAIEKNAYNQYTKLQTIGNIVVVVFGRFDWRWCFVEEMPIIQGSESIEKYPPEKRFLLDADGWICPRKSGRNAGIGSGTPYREIRQRDLREWETFKQCILERLSIMPL